MPPHDRRDFATQAETSTRTDNVAAENFSHGQEAYQAIQGRDQGIRHTSSHRRGQHAAPPPPASTPSPFEAPGAWDTTVIAGVLFLGLAAPDGDVGNALDIKKPKGRDGGTISDAGAVAAEFTITFRVWDRVTWASWGQVFRAIDPQRTPDRRTPVDVTHPALAEKNITRIYVKTVSIAKRVGNEWHYTAKCIQWMPTVKDRRGGSVTRTRRNAQGNGTATATGNTLAGSRTAFAGLADGNEVQTGGAPPDPVLTDTGVFPSREEAADIEARRAEAEDNPP